MRLWILLSVVAVVLMAHAQAADSSSSAVVTITLSNLEENIDNTGGKPVMVEFYAPWCAHCQKLQPVWEEVAENHQNRVRFAKVDCTVEKVVCQRFGVDGYPRILFFPAGSDSSKEYRGPRTVEGLDAYAKRITSPKTTELTSAAKVRAFMSANLVSFLLCDPATGGNKEMRTAFTEVAGQMYDVATFATVTDAEVLKAQQISEPTILVVREGEQTVYTGALDKDSLMSWVKRKRFIMLPELDGFNFKEVSHINNLTAMGLVDPSAQITVPFLKMLRNVARKFEDRISLGYINGVEWKKFLAEYDVSLNTLPRILVVDSEMEYYLALPPNVRSEADITSALDAISKGDIQLKYGWVVMGKRIWNDWWLALIGAAICVVVVPIILLCCLDEGGGDRPETPPGKRD